MPTARCSSQLQRALLPDRLPDVEGLPLTARYLPGGAPDKLGGDWYDVVPLEGGTVALVVGDVAGGDLAATALMAQLRSAVRAYALEGHPPTVVVTRANDFHLALGVGPAGHAWRTRWCTRPTGW